MEKTNPGSRKSTVSKYFKKRGLPRLNTFEVSNWETSTLRNRYSKCGCTTFSPLYFYEYCSAMGGQMGKRDTEADDAPSRRLPRSMRGRRTQIPRLRGGPFSRSPCLEACTARSVVRCIVFERNKRSRNFRSSLCALYCPKLCITCWLAVSECPGTFHPRADWLILSSTASDFGYFECFLIFIRSLPLKCTTVLTLRSMTQKHDLSLKIGKDSIRFYFKYLL